MKLRKISAAALTLAATLLVSGCATKDEKAASALAGRVLAGGASDIRFVQTADTVDVFTISKERGKIVISGPDANSMAMGLGYLIRHVCGKDISWYDYYSKPALPEDIGLDGPVRIEALVPERFFLNYCTYGYTMPFWGWDQWEHFIDWMAMMGITMPLANTGQEAVWQKVWRRHGMTDEEIRAYFSGPAHLPWHRMNNIDAWEGPLPQHWIDSQAELQKKILRRCRSLGMKPILSGFSGHVPGKLREIYPDAPISEVSVWCNFSKPYHCYYLDPSSPLFKTIQKEFLEEQQKMFGTDHLYGIDPFNEVEAPSWDPGFLASESRGIYESITAADPEGVWVQMAWFLINQPGNWTPERTEAFLGGVPEGKMILLDYAVEMYEGWKSTNCFYGQPYILNYLGNFGGHTSLAAPDIEILDKRLDEALARGGSNLLGFGATLEGFGLHQYLYEFTMDKAWDMGLDWEKWTESYARRFAADAAALLRRFVHDYVPSGQGGAPKNGTGPFRRPTYRTWASMVPVNTADAEDFLRKTLELGSEGYLYENLLVNAAIKLLAYKFQETGVAFWDKLTAAEPGKYPGETLILLQKDYDRLIGLLDDMERLAACNPELSLSRWISQARSWAVSPSEEYYYDTNARTILTVWGEDATLDDYATRGWSGLIGSYFKGRWTIFLDYCMDCVKHGTAFDEAACDALLLPYQREWVKASTPVEYASPAPVVPLCEEMLEKY